MPLDSLWGMRNPPSRTAPSGAGATSAIFDRLEREWRVLVRLPASRAEARAWGASEPALRGADARQVIAGVDWHGFQPSAPGSLVLSALLRQAASPLVARALLQALLPRIRSERVQTPTYGHGVGEHWLSASDTVADLVAECFVAITEHAGEDRDDVDRLIVGRAARRLRTARQAQRRYQSRHVVLAGGHVAMPAGELSGALSAAEWLASAIVDAVRADRITSSQARLVYATRVQGVPASEAGRAQGLAPKAVYYALARAEEALVTAGVAGAGRARRATATATAA
jgi:DNA-directed RNA polymerase specialized sigma24 family protein